MTRKLLLALLATGWVLPAWGANIRSFIEKVRIQAPVVYCGEVKAVEILERTKFELSSRATVTVTRAFRGTRQGAGPREARLSYSSFDETTPALDGGPQYRLDPGEVVLAFASSFDGSPAYLLHGRPQYIAEMVQGLRRSLAEMDLSKHSTAGMDASKRWLAEVVREGVTEETRKSQLKVYDDVLAFLGERYPKN